MSCTDISFTLKPALAGQDLMNTCPLRLPALFIYKGLLRNCRGKGFDKCRLFETTF